MTHGTVFNIRNVLIVLGIIITTIGVVFFATEFMDRLSDWGRLISLVLLTVMFLALGRHFETQGEGGALVHARGWRWLRVNTALYVLGLVSTFTTVIFFIGMDDVDRLAKFAVTTLAGLGLIFVAARRFTDPH